jgi:hypothetical protein
MLPAPLLMLHRAGGIELPAVRQKPFNPFVLRERPQPMLVDQTLLAGPLRGPNRFLGMEGLSVEPISTLLE